MKNITLTPDTALLFIAHGSRRTAANQEIKDFIDTHVRPRYPNISVNLGYIELAKPSIEEAVAKILDPSNAASTKKPIKKIIFCPILLFRAGHAKNDLSLIKEKMSQKYKDISFAIADVLGVHSDMVDLISKRAQEAVQNDNADMHKQTSILIIGRGSSDPDANADFAKVSRLFTETEWGEKFLHCVIAYAGVTKPSIEDSLDLIIRGRPQKIVIIPYLLIEGFLIEKIQKTLSDFESQYKWIKFLVGKPLGLNEKIADLLNYRIQQVLNNENNFICDTCKYRVPLKKVNEVNGLRALLWSVRHQFTHNQAMPSEHAHPKLKKHILLCGNIDCAKNGSIGVLAVLREHIKKRNLTKEILVTRTSCMGRCSDGPSLVVYPDGIWYKEVQESDVPQLIEKHLINDQLVHNLIDNIMD